VIRSGQIYTWDRLAAWGRRGLAVGKALRVAGYRRKSRLGYTLRDSSIEDKAQTERGQLLWYVTYDRHAPSMPRPRV
jgi:hypothetical protein